MSEHQNESTEKEVELPQEEIEDSEETFTPPFEQEGTPAQPTETSNPNAPFESEVESNTEDE
jgi:hypothetical protein